MPPSEKKPQSARELASGLSIPCCCFSAATTPSEDRSNAPDSSGLEQSPLHSLNGSARLQVPNQQSNLIAIRNATRLAPMSAMPGNVAGFMSKSLDNRPSGNPYRELLFGGAPKRQLLNYHDSSRSTSSVYCAERKCFVPEARVRADNSPGSRLVLGDSSVWEEWRQLHRAGLSPEDVIIDIEDVKGGEPHFFNCGEFTWWVYFNLHSRKELPKLSWVMQQVVHFARYQDCPPKSQIHYDYYETWEAFAIDGLKTARGQIVDPLRPTDPAALGTDLNVPKNVEFAVKKIKRSLGKTSKGDLPEEEISVLGTDLWHIPDHPDTCGSWMTDAYLYWVETLPPGFEMATSGPSGSIPHRATAPRGWADEEVPVPQATRQANCTWSCCPYLISGTAGFQSARSTKGWEQADSAKNDARAT
ncbi:MAG: hypothetical protein FD180_2805 [Planctomycetota bacterium]|nr:MAG: hypothetical protein FD180_2805 [Planctomycetota bacterium]